jgi:hypothetical protein
MKVLNYYLREGSLLKFPNVLFANKLKSLVSRIKITNRNLQTDIRNKIREISSATKNSKLFPVKSEVTEVKQLSDLLKRSEKIDGRLNKFKDVNFAKIPESEAASREASVKYAEKLTTNLSNDFKKIEVKADGAIEKTMSEFGI